MGGVPTPAMAKPPGKGSDRRNQLPLPGAQCGSALLRCRCLPGPSPTSPRSWPGHRCKTGSRWRKLNPGQQALLVLAHLRKGETFAELAAGFGISTATAWRYASEAALLAARAPKLRGALRGAKKAGHAFVVIDGTLIPVDRLAADRPFYSGKHRKHGMNLQVIASPAR